MGVAGPIPLVGKVVDTVGRVVPGASVTIVGSSTAVPEIALLTGEDGCVRLALAAGCYRFKAFGAEGREGEIRLDVGTGGPNQFEIQISR